MKKNCLLAHRLNLNPDNLLIRTALTHKSYETDSLVEENSKLAVLGKQCAWPLSARMGPGS